VLKFEALGLTLAPLFVQLGAPVEELRIARRAGKVAVGFAQLFFGEGVGRREWRERGGEGGINVVHDVLQLKTWYPRPDMQRTTTAR